MRIGLYLENFRINNIDLSKPWLGNPGIGGTEFNFVTLAYYLQQCIPNIEVTVYANSIDYLGTHVFTRAAIDCNDALQQAEQDNVDFFIWRPTLREDSRLLLKNTDIKVPVIAWAHNTLDDYRLTLINNNRAVSHLVCVGREQYRRLGDRPVKNKALYIHNGFEISPFINSPVGDKGSGKWVIYLGSLVPVKGFGMLAKVWKRIITKVPDARLIVIGSGQLYNQEASLGRWGIAEAEFEEELIPYLSDDSGNCLPSVEFKGIMGTEKIPLLKAATVGVVNPTGEGENCPGSAIEFLASGVPVVSANCQGLLDVVDHDVTGLLGIGETDLEENIVKLLENETLAKTMGERGPEVINRRFNYQRVCNKWHLLFKAITSIKREINDGGYFPYISANELQEDREFRKKLGPLTSRKALMRYSLRTLLTPSRVAVWFSRRGDFTVVRRPGHRKLYFPWPIPQVKLLHSSLNYEKWLLRKYTFPGFLEIESGDVVVDCGAFVGGYTLGAASKAARIYAFEPDKLNYACLKNNTEHLHNVTIEHAGLYHETTEMDFNISSSGVEHSLLKPDNGVALRVDKIKVFSLDDYFLSKDIKTIDLLKLEAEGTELEILKGMTALNVRKIAVDCSPEREGKSPLQEIKLLLTEQGYITTKRGWNLFAIREE